MITKPTVIVLGAGASIDFGFPSGAELYHAITRLSYAEMEQKTDDRFAGSFELFQRELRGSRLGSIDAFLARRPEYMEEGKRAIAIALLPKESREALSPNHEIWCDLLFKKMAPLKIDDFGANKLTIVTFNYDRALECFLFERLRHTFGATPTAAAAAVESIPVIHVHGQLGPLPWQPSGRPYGGPLGRGPYTNAADSLITVSEADGETAQFKAAREAIQAAQRIYYLGFSYDPASLKRLGLPLKPPLSHVGAGSLLTYAPTAGVFGCSFGLTGAEVEAAWEFITPSPLNVPHMTRAKALEFLREVEALDAIERTD